MVFMLTGAAFLIRLQSPEPQYIWCAWERAAAEIKINEANTVEPVKIYVFEDLVAYHFWFALRDSDKFEVNVVKGIDGLNEDTAYFLPRGFGEVKVTDLSGIHGERFWVAFRAGKWDLFSPPLSDISLAGYRFEQPLVFDVDSQSVFAAETTKGNKY